MASKQENNVLTYAFQAGIASLSMFAVYQSFNSSQTSIKKKKMAIPQQLKDSPYPKELKLAVELALKAGSNMVGYMDEKGTEAESGHDLGINTKNRPEDFSTNIDVKNEKLVTDGILAVFPHHKIIGEEAVGTGEMPKITSGPTWIIDPIDGTTNFARYAQPCSHLSEI
jgi:hypothetical protein